MKRKIIRGAEYCAVTEDGILVEYVPIVPSDQYGDILLARTGRIMPGMDCAFLDIGRKRQGFLPLNEESGSFTEKRVVSGETMIVQIKKEETGGKGAFLTRDITLPGNLVIVMPKNRYIGVSRKIRGEEERERLKKAGSIIAGGRFGLVMRYASAKADPEEAGREAGRLFAAWEQTEALARAGGKPGTILWKSDPAVRITEDYHSGENEIIPETDNISLDIKRQLRMAAERIVPLPGGGNIIIDRCEAMTVIDVNTASSAGRSKKEHTVLSVNMEACAVIAQQVRLRNASGIILIDFIDMASETDQSLVSDKLAECFSNDRIKTVIHGWTSLGLMEMTRKRTRPSLYEELFDTCPSCDGKGYRIREQKE